MERVIEKINSLTPTFVLVVSTVINHVCKDNRPLDFGSFMVILSPTIPTILPVIMSIITDALKYLVKHGIPPEWAIVLMTWLSWLQWLFQLDAWFSYFGIFGDGHGHGQGDDDDDGQKKAAGAAEEEYHIVPVSMKVDVVFMQAFVKYLTSHATFEVDEKLAVTVENTQTMIETQVWKKIHFVHEESALEVYVSNLQLQFTRRGEDIFLSSFSRFSAKQQGLERCKEFRELHDFIDNPAVLKFLEMAYAAIPASNLDRLKNYSPVVNTIDCCVTTALKTFCPNLDVRKFAIEMVLLEKLECHMGFPNSAGTANFFHRLKSYSINTKGRLKLFEYEFVCMGSAMNQMHTSYTSDLFSMVALQPSVTAAISVADLEKISAFIGEYYLSLKQNEKTGNEITEQSAESHKNKDGSSSSSSSAASSSSSSSLEAAEENRIEFKVRSLLKPCPIASDVHNTFVKVIRQIQASGQVFTEGAKIKIFNVVVTKTETFNKTPNPDYDRFMERKTQLTDLLKATNGGGGGGGNGASSSEAVAAAAAAAGGASSATDIQMMLMNLMQQEIPPKEHVQKVIKSEVKVTPINEKFKSMSTTYLRERDMRNLIHVLNNFRNNQKMFTEYGLPNKLGVMLHGLPGTGKTTVIHAIASLLQKDIYYVNLSTITTNAQLQMVFDEVLLKSSKGGIVVFEDIDAMSKVVHRRDAAAGSAAAAGTGTGVGENTLTDNDNQLTLEYILNLLQGSLTRDGTIFIATTNHIEKLDPAFCRTGRFDVKIQMKKCDHYQIRCIFRNFMKRELEESVLDQIDEDEWTPAEIIFHVIHYMESQDAGDVILEPFLRHNAVKTKAEMYEFM